MFIFRRPDARRAGDILAAQGGLPFSYPHVGTTGGRPPTSYDVGRGREVYRLARAALAGWKMFPEPLGKLYWPSVPIKAGTVVAVAIKAGCVWSLNACRIVYVIDRSGDAEQYGFAYGTLGDHLLSGEERLTVRWYPAAETVWYELCCYSRPRRLPAWLGYPIVRRQQRRFRRAMLRAVEAALRRRGVVRSCIH